MISVEGNRQAIDGNKAFRVSINNGSDYIVGGIVGDDVYYSTVQITVQEDDGILITLLDNHLV